MAIVCTKLSTQHVTPDLMKKLLSPMTNRPPWRVWVEANSVGLGENRDPIPAVHHRRMAREPLQVVNNHVK